MKKQNQEIIIYKAKDGQTQIDVRFEKETVWLTQQTMAELFKVTVPNISMHIRNIYNEGELIKKPTVKKFLTVQKEGERDVTREREHYNLDMILSVGYRVKSKVATGFRQWATKVLRNHIVKGYTINEKRLKEQAEKFADLQNAVKTLTSVIAKKELTSEEATGILQVLSEYNYALEILDQYDHEKLKVHNVTKKDIYKIEYEELRKHIDKMGEDKKFSPLFGKEKDESFKSSISTIYQSFDGKQLYPSVEEKAANLLYFIVKNHSFVDGNKRIAAFIFVWFMNKNGILYDENRRKRIADNALVALTLLIAESKSAEKDTIVKIVVNLINREN